MRMVATMSDDMSSDRLRNLAAVMIMGAPGLTDELTDVEARSLIDQCLLQAEAAVDALLVSADVAGLPAADAGEMIAERIAPVRRFMGAVNKLVGKRRSLTPDQMLEELDGLRKLAEELPLPPGTPLSEGALSLLAHWPTERENLGFVLALLHAFGPAPAARPPLTRHHTEAQAGQDARPTPESDD